MFRTEGQASEFHPVAGRQGNGCQRRHVAELERAAQPYEMKRINHEEAYSLDGACTNWAENF